MSLYDMIKDFCDDYNGDGDISFYGNYSGRYMYGRLCPGIVCDNPVDTVMDLMAYFADVYDGDIWELRNDLGAPRTDNMGLQSIVYFPRVSVPADADDDDDDDD